VNKELRAVLEQIEAKRALESRNRALRALGNVLATDDGRTALWYLLGRTGMYAQSIWDSSARIHANAALRDFGYEMQFFMVEANEQAVFDMQRAEWHRAVSERLEDEKILKESE
jgi:hypothetical protein